MFNGGMKVATVCNMVHTRATPFEAEVKSLDLLIIRQICKTLIFHVVKEGVGLVVLLTIADGAKLKTLIEALKANFGTAAL